MKLTCWLKLWNILLVIGLLFGGMSAYLILSNKNNISHIDDCNKYIGQRYQIKTIREVNCVRKSELIEEMESLNLITEVQLSHDHIIYFISNLTTGKMVKASRKLWDVLAKQARSNPVKIIFGVLICWLILVTVIYLLGWIAGWIYRVFKHK